jgi:hypothetical protein
MRKFVISQLVILLGGFAILLAADLKSYGEGVTQGEPTAIADILANPDVFAGKTVRVEGKITDVCRKAGCWMDIRDDAGRGIQIKVEDGVIVFPASAIGNRAVAEGKIEVLDMNREGYVAWMRHMAEENGREFDASSIGDPPYRIVRVRASGATIGE